LEVRAVIKERMVVSNYTYLKTLGIIVPYIPIGIHSKKA
jgi:hypothetical protein